MISKSNNMGKSYVIQFIFIGLIHCVFFTNGYSQKEVDQSYINQFKRLTVSNEDNKLLHRNNNGIVRCASELVNKKRLRMEASKVLEELQNFRNSQQNSLPDQMNVLEIPVIFHIIHNGDPVDSDENISSIFIEEQIKQANHDFRKIAGTSGEGDGVDTRIQFIPATVDPLGNILSEPGINRIDISYLNLVSPYSISTIEEVIKHETIWNPNLYLNSWTLDIADGILGYAQYPTAADLVGIGMDSITDGVVVRYKSIGSTELSFPSGDPFNAGRTWTHEAGHFLGLIHIWGEGDCTVDDFCEDTPNTAGPAFGCPFRDSCPMDLGDDQVENYMDYTDDACMNIFSRCQADRMRFFLGATGEESIRRVSLVNSTVGVTDGFALIMNDPEERACISDKATFNFTVTYVGSFTEDVRLSFTDLPNGVDAVFTEDTISNSGNYAVDLINLDILTPDSYQFTMLAADHTGKQVEQPITLNVDFAIAESPTLLQPVSQSSSTALPVEFDWTPISYVAAYEIQIAFDNQFSNLEESSIVTNTSYVASNLLPNQTYFWRVRAQSACNFGEWSDVNTFTSGDVIPCLVFDIGPFIDFNEVNCYPKCETAIRLTEEVWANEAYLIQGITEGAEYIFEFCDGYDPTLWAATITVTDEDQNFIAAATGCSLTFESTISGAILVIISDSCGGSLLQVDNGIPTFTCSSEGQALPQVCQTCLVEEDFEAGLPVDWSVDVTGAGIRTNWVVDDHPFAFFIFSGYLANNPGFGNWLYYDDDANGPVEGSNIATATSPIYNLSGIEDLALGFDYAYVDQGFNSEVFLSLSDGTQTLYFDGTNWSSTKTLWLDSDSNGTFSEEIPESLNRQNVQASITYDDAGQWAWGFGFDNFAICGNCAVFDDLGIICENSVAPSLPLTSSNGFAGTWSPPMINTANVGVSTYTFSPTAQTPCGDISVNIKVTAEDDASFFYPADVFCNSMADPMPAVKGEDGGLFSSQAGLEIDMNTGVIDLRNSLPGIYSVSYMTNGLCQSTTSQPIEIVAEFECPTIITENLIASNNVLKNGEACQCENLRNCYSRAEDQLYIQDSLRIPAVGHISSGLDIRIASASNFFIGVECSLNGLELPTFGMLDGTRIPEVAPGVYMLEYWQTSEEPTTLSIISGNGLQVDASSDLFIDNCNCPLAIPTMGEWALILLMLLLLIISIVQIKEANKKKPQLTT